MDFELDMTSEDLLDQVRLDLNQDRGSGVQPKIDIRDVLTGDDFLAGI